VDDIEYFHRFIGPEEPKEKTKKKPDEGGSPFDGMMQGGGPGGIPGMGPTMPGMPGMPGATGTKPKPKR
jgi:hypothetical protein